MPTDRESLSRAMAKLKLSRLLEGFRGQPAGDRKAAVDAVLSLAEFAAAQRATLEELEVNPLLVLPHGVAAVDVLLRMARFGDEEADANLGR